MTLGEAATLAPIVLASYALTVYPLYRIARHTADLDRRAWWAWVPLVNVVLMCRIGRVPAWTAPVLLLMIIPALKLAVFAYVVYLWARIGKRFGRTWLGVAAGVLPLFGPWALAFGIDEERAPSRLA
jgi:hypothetical protein